jgi:hypothetical protein
LRAKRAIKNKKPKDKKGAKRMGIKKRVVGGGEGSGAEAEAEV